MFDAKKVRKQRKKQGISQKRLSAMTKIPVKSIRFWEQNDETPIQLIDIINIAEALDCYIDDFI